MQNNTPKRCEIGALIALIGIAAIADCLALAPAAAEETQHSAQAPTVFTELPSKALETWRAAIRRVPAPRKGCFTAAYPNTEWTEVPCVSPPELPYPPTRPARPEMIGGTTNGDVAAVVTPLITSATGSFDSATVPGETGTEFAAGCSNPITKPDTFSLQLNSEFFSTSACSTGKPGCFGWQQFVYSNEGKGFIQYWLGSYGPSCPSGWKSAGGGNCFFSAQGVQVPRQLATNLGRLTLAGNTRGGQDNVVVTVTGMAYMSAPMPDSMLNLAQAWHTVEFNVLGDACASEANFDSGTTIVGRTSIDDGSLQAPGCTILKNTGETNNLYWEFTPPVPSGVPALLFTESSSANTLAACAVATSVGDTHLTTFGGLLYDFQASGDFVLVHADQDFIVQTRQVSGAPAWPNASTNTAVAAKMGRTQVAICLNPTRLEVNGSSTQLTDSNSLSLNGVKISRKGAVYSIIAESGDSVQATLTENAQNSWIDVSVGLGHLPQARLSGLLANVTGNVGAIAEANGTALNMPVSFDALYRRYADSWRVPRAESLLCEGPVVETNIPSRPLYAGDLNPMLAKRAQGVCRAAGVSSKGLLEACTLDVAVLGNKDAARVFVGRHAPAAVMPSPHTEPGSKAQ